MTTYFKTLVRLKPTKNTMSEIKMNCDEMTTKINN